MSAGTALHYESARQGITDARSRELLTHVHGAVKHCQRMSTGVACQQSASTWSGEPVTFCGEGGGGVTVENDGVEFSAV